MQITALAGSLPQDCIRPHSRSGPVHHSDWTSLLRLTQYRGLLHTFRLFCIPRLRDFLNPARSLMLPLECFGCLMRNMTDDIERYGMERRGADRPLHNLDLKAPASISADRAGYGENSLAAATNRASLVDLRRLPRCPPPHWAVPNHQSRRLPSAPGLTQCCSHTAIHDLHAKVVLYCSNAKWV